MKLKITLIIFLVINTTQFFLGAQSTNKSDIKLYHCMLNLPPKYIGLMARNGIELAPLIDGRYIDPGNKDTFNEQAFVDGIKLHFPNVTDTGVGIIDWETKTFDNLCFRGADNASLKESLNRFIRILDVAKRTRPFVKWGVYNIPYLSYWQTSDEHWQKQGELLAPLLNKVDLLMLSLYDYYEDGTKSADDKAYVNSNMRMALSVSKNTGKPLYVFVWNRYHESNEMKGLELIPQKEFTSHVQQILQSQFGDIEVAGLIWFDAQEWFYSQKKSLPDSDAKLLSTSVKNVRDVALEKYGHLLRESVNLQNLANKESRQ